MSWSWWGSSVHSFCLRLRFKVWVFASGPTPTGRGWGHCCEPSTGPTTTRRSTGSPVAPFSPESCTLIINMLEPHPSRGDRDRIWVSGSSDESRHPLRVSRGASSFLVGSPAGVSGLRLLVTEIPLLLHPFCLLRFSGLRFLYHPLPESLTQGREGLGSTRVRLPPEVTGRDGTSSHRDSADPGCPTSSFVQEVKDRVRGSPDLPRRRKKDHGSWV